ncbi:DUF2125 domain-containing protein [Aliiruegeria sabulilitoris]|uniref:DUF2125 domain-containing protein n=1 Tax=Aliiruegeria sabulilitoris TaxID=1510458 RepID=UPI000830F5C5|nr:DUF2125 domain-containing protein [Aliiruegeria sabulilitoris]NDR57203.1 DUF2125 domain-containing protein [Pseudoruegeria sp. M32A2M]
MKPIRLLWLTVLVVLGWSAWWGWGAWNAKTGLETWLEARREAGWQAEWDRIEVQGFPTRIDRTISGLVLANTEKGWVWQAPFFQILGLNYQKDHVILVWPNDMTLQTPWQTVAITGDELRGSVTFRPGSAQELQSATLVFDGLALDSDAGWTSSMAQVRLATRPNEAGEGQHDIGLEIVGLKPRSDGIAMLAKAGLVPATVDELKADLTVGFDRPWDRQALEEDRPQPREIDIHEIAAKWGKLELRIAGALTVASDGVVSGEVMVKSTNWREMLEIARRSGFVPDSLADPIESALSMLSGLAGRSDTLDIPLAFENGRTRLGPLPLGRAPVLAIP